MSESWNNVKTVCCKPWLVLPTVYSDALSYGEQLDKFCYSLNKLIENNNILPDFIADKIKEYISSGAIGEVVQEILANYILNVKYPPKGITPAVGDGSADDTEALQGCIDYASANGGVVYFPYGSYLTQPLTMKNGVSLFGFDRYSTKVVLKGGATKALLNGNGNNFSVCNLTLDGNSGIQVNDVNVVDITGSNLMFNDLVIKDGYKLFNFVGDGHLQLSNIVFGNAVENCFTVDGNVIVQTNNLLFTALSKVGGVSVVDIRANGGNYDFNSVAKCDTCMLISGNDNKVVALIGDANEDYADTGEHNNVEIVGHSQKEYYSGNVKKDANNSETTLQGTRSLHVVGNSTVAYDSDSTESVDGNKSEIVTGITTETYKNNKVTNLTNETKALSGKKVTKANSVTETITSEKTVNANSVAENITGEKTVNANSVAETISNGYTITANELFLNTATPLKYGEIGLENNHHFIRMMDKTGVIYKIPVNDFINAAFINVKDYGAVGDGITDDSDSFNECFKNNGVIYVPEGSYLISKPLKVSANSFIIGHGSKLIKNGNFMMFDMYLNNESEVYPHDTTIAGFEIYGKNNTDTGSIFSIGMADGVINSTINNLSFIDLYIHDVKGRPFDILYGTPETFRKHYYGRISINNCTLKNIGDIGVCVSGGTVSITNCRIDNTDLESITIDNGCINCIVSDNILTNAKNGYGVIGSGIEGEYIKFSNNTIYTTGSLPGIAMGGGTGDYIGAVISNNTIIGGKYSMLIDAGTNFTGTISGNNFINNVTNPIKCTGSSTGALINFIGNTYTNYTISDMISALMYIGKSDISFTAEIDNYFNDGYTPVTNRNYMYVNGNNIEITIRFDKSNKANGDIPLTIPHFKGVKNVDVFVDGTTEVILRDNGDIQIYGDGYVNTPSLFERTIIFML